MWKYNKVIKNGPYLFAVVKDHPKANKHGYVYEHRIVMENHLGRILNDNELVHHIDENKHNNKIENLELTTESHHKSLHGKSRGRSFYILKCPNCNETFEIEKRQSYLSKGKKFQCCSISCGNSFKSKLIDQKDLNLLIENHIIKEFKKYF